ncbi:MAG: acyl carrier protein [Betaproteobacteria bacterium]|mgnify:CR=1 FL=1|jgi:acyl carrier protein|nr:acyl carrier protein [Betaproteobacteria bacterium]HMV20639.1 acyl carrier protein [Rhodocyclaceae bacterium]HMW76676.1 acyl carrier protein [Rhodocyclaceae bacterium]HNE42777.1 acyl carrier protein [Rhodocyclaceae bacterium]HNL21776.1 acyl carrier protein [Rhodocyclaceae bacterium]
MNSNEKEKVREFLTGLMGARGDHGPIEDSQSIFVSGRLDSLAITNLVLFLETEFGVSFADTAFDIDLIDSIAAIEEFVTRVRV